MTSIYNDGKKLYHATSPCSYDVWLRLRLKRSTRCNNVVIKQRPLKPTFLWNDAEWRRLKVAFWWDDVEWRLGETTSQSSDEMAFRWDDVAAKSGRHQLVKVFYRRRRRCDDDESKWTVLRITTNAGNGEASWCSRRKNTHFLCKRKYLCASDLHFVCFEFTNQSFINTFTCSGESNPLTK